MSLMQKIRDAQSGREQSYKQRGFLSRLTGLKWWQPESLPQPTIDQASLLIEACLNYIETRQNGDELLQAIQLWFPSFNDLSKIHHRYGKGAGNVESSNGTNSNGHAKSGSNGHSSNGSTGSNGKGSSKRKPKMPERDEHGKFLPRNGKSKTQKEANTEVETATLPKPQPETNTTPKTDPKKVVGTGVDELVALIEAGQKNIWMVGPAGCGKTTMAMLAGEKLEMDVAVIACGAGTSATTFLGYKYPERESTKFVNAFSQPGIIILDEFPTLEAQVAQIVNAALANGELDATTGTFQRDPDCIIIATGNTFGYGADRMYNANNQLDEATRDRFTGGKISVDYSKEYESQFDPEVVKYVWHLRDVIQRNGMRKLASTRAIIAGEKLKKAGISDWKQRLIVDWSTDEKALV